MEHLATPTIPVSWGELLDKLSILAIKRVRIDDPVALANVDNEHRQLRAVAADALGHADLAPLIGALRQVNEALWDTEDAIRAQEAAGRFGAEFVQLARSVYQHNDERARIKRQINALLGSELVEEKSYAGAAQDTTLRATPAR